MLPQTPEETEAWRLLWPVPPLRVGPGGPIGIDVAEIRARIRRGFDPDVVIALAQDCEGAILEHFHRKKEGPSGGT